MSHPLQEFDFRHSNYDRPNQKWTCGWAGQGVPCHVGPDSRGRCQAHRECIPAEGEEGFTCTRPKDWGGKCKEGPCENGTCPHQRVKCQPQRSLFAKRRLLTVLTVCLALGSLMLLFGERQFSTFLSPAAFISPGDLPSHHHNLSCHKCHLSEHGQAKTDGAAIDRLKSWLDKSLSPATVTSSVVLSDQCRACHDKFGDNAPYTHNLPPDELADISKRIAAHEDGADAPMLLSLVSQIGPGFPKNEKHEMACNICHKDHRGRNFNPKRMTNQQCQTCHTTKFHSFSDGHPQLTDYPHKRRTRIYFDHVKHLDRHFAEFKRIMPNGAKLQCKHCHHTEPSGRLMIVRSFETACAGCHADQIGNSLVPGLAVYNLPSLDLDTLIDKKVKIGQWPGKSDANAAILDGELTPFMELLMAASAESNDLLEQVRELDLRDLSNASDEQLKLVEAYVWNIKEVLYDLQNRGRKHHEQWLRQALGDNAKPEELSHLSVLPPSEVIEDAVDQWFPELSNEIKKKREDETVDVAARFSDSSDSNTHSTVDSAGWYFEAWDLSIRYRPSEHADSFVKTWLDVSCRFESAGSGVEDTVGRETSARHSTQQQLKHASLSRIFDELAQVTATGHCMKCHTLDQDRKTPNRISTQKNADAGLHVNWFSIQHDMDVKKFTKFSHQPHITFLTEDNCEKCHQLDKPLKTERAESLFRNEFVHADWSLNRDPHSVRTSGLQLIQSECAGCHTKQKAGDRCLQCHNYHVGHFIRMK